MIHWMGVLYIHYIQYFSIHLCKVSACDILFVRLMHFAWRWLAGNVISNMQNAAISVQESFDCEIYGNTVDGAEYGIRMNTGSGDNMVHDNKFNDILRGEELMRDTMNISLLAYYLLFFLLWFSDPKHIDSGLGFQTLSYGRWDVHMFLGSSIPHICFGHRAPCSTLAGLCYQVVGNLRLRSVFT